MNTNHRDRLVNWLNHAYTNEKSLVSVLESHAKHAGSYPDLQDQYVVHARQTGQHAIMVEHCLNRLGTRPSTNNSEFGNISGWVHGTSMAMDMDAVVKDIVADYAMEHREIACYLGLIATAEQADEMLIANICREILFDEEQMARWLREQLPHVICSHAVQHA